MNLESGESPHVSSECALATLELIQAYAAWFKATKEGTAAAEAALDVCVRHTKSAYDRGMNRQDVGVALLGMGMAAAASSNRFLKGA